MSDLEDEDWAALFDGDFIEPNYMSDDEDFFWSESSEEEDDFVLSELEEEEDINPSEVPPDIQFNNPPAAENPEDPEMVQKVRHILAFIHDQGLDLQTFMDAFAWGHSGCTSDPHIRGARRSFMNSPQFKTILDHMLRPPGSSLQHERASQTVLHTFIRDAWLGTLSKELERLAKFFHSPHGEDITDKALTGLDFAVLLEKVGAVAPNLWDTLYTLASTEKQRTRNTKKDPVRVCLKLTA